MKKKNKLLSAITCLSVFSTAIIGTTSTSYASEVEPVEITTMRSEYEKHFDNGDGTITAFVNTAPLHFENNGQWEEIDNTLMVDENGDYVNKNNPMKVSIENQASLKNTSEITDDQIVEIEYKGYTLSWDIVDVNDKKANSNKAKKSSDIKIKKNKNSNNGKSKLSKETDEIMNKINAGAVYDSFDENMNLSVDITPQSVKDTVTLIEPDPTLTEVTYFIHAKKLTPKLYEDGSVDFFDKNNEVIFNIPPAFMFDSSENPEYNFEIETELTKYKNGYLLTLTPDYEWLNSSERVYPVMIDPEVTLNSGFTGTYIDEQYSTKNYTNSFLKLGGSYSQSTRKEVLLTFPENFSNFSPSMNVISAECNLYIINISENSNKELPEIQTSAILNNSNLNQFTWSNTRINGTFSEGFSKTKISCEDNSKYCTFDITGLAQTWLNYAKTSQVVGIPNYGLRLSPSYATNDYETITMLSPLSSTNKPYYTMTYTLRTPYTLNYAPYKYNDIGNSVKNFQRRMNCYAYALQVYYNNLGNYSLYPGEIGIGKSIENDKYTVATFGSLKNHYDTFEENIRNRIKELLNIANIPEIYSSQVQSYVEGDEQFTKLMDEYMLFIENQMRRDALKMNFNISKYDNSKILNKSKEFVLPSNYNENSERIIAMISYYLYNYKYDGILTFHYYLRNGNGSCPIHNDNCSMWSQKMGMGQISNNYGEVTHTDENNNIICDKNIYKYSYNIGSYNAAHDNNLIDFYSITKDTNVYNYKHGNGQNSNSTGTVIY